MSIISLTEQIVLDIAELNCQQETTATKLDVLNAQSSDHLLCQLNTLVELVKLTTEQSRQFLELKRIVTMVEKI